MLSILLKPTIPVALRKTVDLSFRFSQSARCLMTSLPHAKAIQSLSEEPIKFSGSEADTEAISTFQGRRSGAPPYQPICVVLSLTAFMLYFCVLREENDIDEYLGTNVYMFADPYGEAAKLRAQLQKEIKAGTDPAETKAKLEQVYNIIKAKRGDYGALESSLKRIQAEKEAQRASKQEASK